MDNHTPDKFENDAPASDFLQLLLSQKHQFPNATSNATASEVSPSSPLMPPVEPPDFPASDTGLNQWAEQRLSVYASLDATLNRHIIEAINTLNELKRQAEAEAAQTSYILVSERDRLRQEVADLQQEQVRLQQELQENRRLAAEEAARQAQAKIERDELERELNRLKIQIEGARRTFLAASAEQAASDTRRSGVWKTLPLTRNISPAAPVLDEAAFATPAPETPPVPALPTLFLPDKSPASVNLEKAIEADNSAVSRAFGDAPTPRILGGSPVLTPIAPLSLVPREQASRPRPANLITASTFAYLQELLMSDWPDVPLADVPEASASLDPNPSTAVSERPRTGTGPLRFGAADLGHTADLPRQGQTDQLGENKRRRITGPLVPEMVPELVLPAATGPGLAGISGSERRKRGTNSLSEAEKSQRVVLRELGLQLGLADPMTPPAFNTISFAQGYTPPNGVLSLADLLDEIKANAFAITPPPLDLAAIPEKKTRRVVEPPPPISFDQDMADYNIDEERPNPTLEELLEAGEQELASINDDPTPPDNPTPFIGKLGPEHPVHFQTSSTVTPKPEPLTMLNQEIEADSPVTQSFRMVPARLDEPGNTPPPTRSFRPLSVQPLRPRPAPPEVPENIISFPLVLPFQPQLGMDTVKTQVTISNLHGRYSLQMLERVLRDLVGVAQVLVTEFGKGVLVMEVSHRPNLNLVAQLLTLPQLPLKLKEEGTNILVFVQGNRPGENG